MGVEIMGEITDDKMKQWIEEQKEHFARPEFAHLPCLEVTADTHSPIVDYDHVKWFERAEIAVNRDVLEEVEMYYVVGKYLGSGGHCSNHDALLFCAGTYNVNVQTGIYRAPLGRATFIPMEWITRYTPLTTRE